MIQFESEEMEVMKRSGQVVGEVAYGNRGENITEFYQLDRARGVEEFEKQIKNIGLKSISIGKKGKSVYTEPLTHLIELINKYKKNYDEIRDIVLVYSTFYFSAIKYDKEKQSSKGSDRNE